MSKHRTKGAFGNAPRRKDVLARERKVCRRLLSSSCSVSTAAFDSKGRNILKRTNGQWFIRY